MHALRTLMQATDTVVLVPRSMMAGACAAGEAAALPLRPATELRAPYGAVWLAGRTLSPAARAFVALVHEVLPEADVPARPAPTALCDSAPTPAFAGTQAPARGGLSAAAAPP